MGKKDGTFVFQKINFRKKADEITRVRELCKQHFTGDEAEDLQLDKKSGGLFRKNKYYGKGKNDSDRLDSHIAGTRTYGPFVVRLLSDVCSEQNKRISNFWKSVSNWWNNDLNSFEGLILRSVKLRIINEIPNWDRHSVTDQQVTYLDKLIGYIDALYQARDLINNKDLDVLFLSLKQHLQALREKVLQDIDSQTALQLLENIINTLPNAYYPTLLSLGCLFSKTEIKKPLLNQVVMKHSLSAFKDLLVDAKRDLSLDETLYGSKYRNTSQDKLPETSQGNYKTTLSLSHEKRDNLFLTRREYESSSWTIVPATDSFEKVKAQSKNLPDTYKDDASITALLFVLGTLQEISQVLRLLEHLKNVGGVTGILVVFARMREETKLQVEHLSKLVADLTSHMGGLIDKPVQRKKNRDRNNHKEASKHFGNAKKILAQVSENIKHVLQYLAEVSVTEELHQALSELNLYYTHRNSPLLSPEHFPEKPEWFLALHSTQKTNMPQLGYDMPNGSDRTIDSYSGILLPIKPYDTNTVTFLCFQHAQTTYKRRLGELIYDSPLVQAGNANRTYNVVLMPCLEIDRLEFYNYISGQPSRLFSNILERLTDEATWKWSESKRFSLSSNTLDIIKLFIPVFSAQENIFYTLQLSITKTDYGFHFTVVTRHPTNESFQLEPSIIESLNADIQRIVCATNNGLTLQFKQVDARHTKTYENPTAPLTSVGVIYELETLIKGKQLDTLGDRLPFDKAQCGMLRIIQTNQLATLKQFEPPASLTGQHQALLTWLESPQTTDNITASEVEITEVIESDASDQENSENAQAQLDKSQPSASLPNTQLEEGQSNVQIIHEIMPSDPKHSDAIYDSDLTRSYESSDDNSDKNAGDEINSLDDTQYGEADIILALEAMFHTQGLEHEGYFLTEKRTESGSSRQENTKKAAGSYILHNARYSKIDSSTSTEGTSTTAAVDYKNTPVYIAVTPTIKEKAKQNKKLTAASCFNAKYLPDHYAERQDIISELLLYNKVEASQAITSTTPWSTLSKNFEVQVLIPFIHATPAKPRKKGQEQKTKSKFAQRHMSVLQATILFHEHDCTLLLYLHNAGGNGLVPTETRTRIVQAFIERMQDIDPSYYVNVVKALPSPFNSARHSKDYDGNMLVVREIEALSKTNSLDYRLFSPRECLDIRYNHINLVQKLPEEIYGDAISEFIKRNSKRCEFIRTQLNNDDNLKRDQISTRIGDEQEAPPNLLEQAIYTLLDYSRASDLQVAPILSKFLIQIPLTENDINYLRQLPLHDTKARQVIQDLVVLLSEETQPYPCVRIIFNSSKKTFTEKGKESSSGSRSTESASSTFTNWINLIRVALKRNKKFCAKLLVKYASFAHTSAVGDAVLMLHQIFIEIFSELPPGSTYSIAIQSQNNLPRQNRPLSLNGNKYFKAERAFSSYLEKLSNTKSKFTFSDEVSLLNLNAFSQLFEQMIANYLNQHPGTAAVFLSRALLAHQLTPLDEDILYALLSREERLSDSVKQIRDACQTHQYSRDIKSLSDSDLSTQKEYRLIKVCVEKYQRQFKKSVSLPNGDKSVKYEADNFLDEQLSADERAFEQRISELLDKNIILTDTTTRRAARPYSDFQRAAIDFANHDLDPDNPGSLYKKASSNYTRGHETLYVEQFAAIGTLAAARLAYQLHDDAILFTWLTFALRYKQQRDGTLSPNKSTKRPIANDILVQYAIQASTEGSETYAETSKRGAIYHAPSKIEQARQRSLSTPADSSKGEITNSYVILSSLSSDSDEGNSDLFTTTAVTKKKSCLRRR